MKGNMELCGGPYGRYGVCGKGLGCTVNTKDFLTTENGRIGICRFACLSTCQRKRVLPVCGSNGMVYKNVCEMERYACLKGLHISTQPLSYCVNNRYCRDRRNCDFVMHVSKSGNIKKAWKQAYKCSGMQTCAGRYSDRPWCASNGKSYSNKCQMNIYGCIIHEKLRPAYLGKCSTSHSEQGYGLLPLDTYTQPIMTYPTDTGTNPDSVPVYNSSDPYSN
ncbi:Follistatin-related protein 4 [Oopsacas minuta]|uniref:Follistatin-related protein 4 n=1 Tax=Oopsacas minuta TaxID=111878 RepID=A0AAV7K3T1_9METZ|nr:Follistatin-related protein 4 [Oopsacas minuta]